MIAFLEYMHLSAPQKSRKGHVALEELCNIAPLTGVGLLHKVSCNWDLSNEASDLCCQPLRRSVLIA